MKNNIAELRKKNGLTQVELGEKLGFGQNTISLWENGICEPSLETLRLLTELFGESVEYIAGFDGCNRKLIKLDDDVVESIDVAIGVMYELLRDYSEDGFVNRPRIGLEDSHKRLKKAIRKLENYLESKGVCC